MSREEIDHLNINPLTKVQARTKKPGFTLAEVLITLTLLGVTSVLLFNILNQPSGKNDALTANALKQDISNAFQVTTSKTGMIQASESPATVITKSLKLKLLSETPNSKEFITDTKWHVSIPKTWSTDSNNKDYVSIRVNSPDNTNYNNVVVYRGNDVQSATNARLAAITPVVIASSSGTTITSSTSTTQSISASTPPIVTPPTVQPTSNIHFSFQGNIAPINRYRLTVTCNGQTIANVLPTNLTVSNVATGVSCNVDAINIYDDTNHRYNDTAVGPFITEQVGMTKEVIIPVTPKKATITFAFTDVSGVTSPTGVAGISQYTLSVVCPNDSKTLTNTAFTALIRSQTGCVVTASGLSNPSKLGYTYVAPPVTFNVGDTASTVNIAVVENAPPWLGLTTVNLFGSDENDHYIGSSATENYYLEASMQNRNWDSSYYFSSYGNATQNQQYFNYFLSQTAGTDTGLSSSVYDNALKSFLISPMFSSISSAGGWNNNKVAGRTWSVYNTEGSKIDTIALNANGSQYIEKNSTFYSPTTGAPFTSFKDACMFAYKGITPNATVTQTNNMSQYCDISNSSTAINAYGTMAIISAYNILNPDSTIKTVFNNNGTKYVVNTAFTRASPIKISLKYNNAVVTDNGSFKFDTDGFHQKTKPVMETTGGLDPTEAWLALDRGHTGIIKNTIIDGDALFGDHMGQFASGYEDLKYAFPAYVKIDSQRTEYIELTPEPWYEVLWRSILKFFGIHAQANPYSDLKLLTSDNHVIDANTVIKRIDVSYKKVKEYSKSGANAIFQRSNVYYTNGKIAESADIWFAPKFYYQLTPLKK